MEARNLILSSSLITLFDYLESGTNAIDHTNNQSNIALFPSMHIASQTTNSHTIPKTQTTQPITDRTVLQSVKQKLLKSGKYGLRNYWIFQLGINIGLRCGDLLSICCGDVFDEQTNKVKSNFIIREEKTGKIQRIALSNEIANELTEYILTLPNHSPNAPIFPSRKGNGHLSVKSYWRILSNIGKGLGIEHMGTHTMRKTFLRAVYDKYKGTLTPDGFSGLDLVQQIANHSSSNTSLRYIGITADTIANVRKSIHL